MVKDLPAIHDLVDRLRRLPYLSSKNVYRVVGYILNAHSDEIQLLLDAIKNARLKLSKCLVCQNWVQESDVCGICGDPNRDKSVICVVETWLDLNSIDRSGQYKGMFHVLGGSISPLEGIGPDKLNIASLISRVESGGIKEVILATNLTPEGEATSSFISSKLATSNVRISRLASGIPMGSTLEFMDKLTISKALEGRIPF